MKETKNIYVLSGLGADKRVFQKIDFGNYKPIFIEWLQPSINENLQEYSIRISKQVIDKQPIVLGISFGGIVAQEIANHIVVEKLYLFATVENRSEIPKYLRILGNLKIDKVIPPWLFKAHNFLIDYFFGVKTKENSRILKSILYDTNGVFLKWALRQIAEWRPLSKPNVNSIITIHGTSDKIFPINNYKKYSLEIIGGGHFFTLTHSTEINKIFEQ